MLTIARRRTLTGEWHDAIRSEVQPRLKLLSQGVMLISQIELHRAVGPSREFYDLNWDGNRGSYTVWKCNACEGEVEMEVISDNWMLLDDSSRPGLIMVNPPPVLSVTMLTDDRGRFNL